MFPMNSIYVQVICGKRALLFQIIRGVLGVEVEETMAQFHKFRRGICGNSGSTCTQVNLMQQLAL